MPRATATGGAGPENVPSRGCSRSSAGPAFFAALARFARDNGIPAAAAADRGVPPTTRRAPLPAAPRHRPQHHPPSTSPASGRGAPTVCAAREMARVFFARARAVANRRPGRARELRRDHQPALRVPLVSSGMTDEEAFRELGHSAAEGAPPPTGGMRPDVRQRLDPSWPSSARGFASYFSWSADIVMQCPRTCGRASAASSIVFVPAGPHARSSPCTTNLFFERFLNGDGSSPPDIDVTSPGNEREACSATCSAPTRDARAWSPTTSVSAGGRRCATRRKPWASRRGIGSMVRFFRLGEPRAHPPYLREAAAALQGFPRNLGTHCGGVVITPGPSPTTPTSRPRPSASR